MNSFMNDHEKIIKRMKKSAISYLARYEVSEFQFKNTMIRKLSNFESELSEQLKIEIIEKSNETRHNYLRICCKGLK